MGKHEAPEGAAVHPLVADALARRTAHGADEPADPAERKSPVGWPAPPAPGGGGLGWPGEEPAQDPVQDTAEEGAPRTGTVAPSEVSRGWRRLFRLRPAA